MPRVKTLETVSHFQSIIKKWRQMVEMEGGKFHIVVLPRKVGTETAKETFLPGAGLEPARTVSFEGF